METELKRLLRKRTTVGDLFANVVRKFPQKTASIMIDDKTSMTFSELEALANQIADYFDVSLHKWAVGAGQEREPLTNPRAFYPLVPPQG